MPVRHTLRFHNASNAVSNETITKHELLEMVMVATGATTSVTLFQSIRLRRIRMWALSSTATNPLGAASSLSVEWKTDIADGAGRLDTQIGDRIAYLDVRPPPKSTASFWILSDAADDDLLAFTCPLNTVLDVTFDAYINSGDYTYLSVATSGKTAGRVYYRFGAEMVPYDLLTF